MATRSHGYMVESNLCTIIIIITAIIVNMLKRNMKSVYNQAILIKTSNSSHMASDLPVLTAPAKVYKAKRQTTHYSSIIRRLDKNKHFLFPPF